MYTPDFGDAALLNDDDVLDIIMDVNSTFQTLCLKWSQWLIPAQLALTSSSITTILECSQRAGNVAPPCVGLPKRLFWAMEVNTSTQSGEVTLQLDLGTEGQPQKAI